MESPGVPGAHPAGGRTPLVSSSQQAKGSTGLVGGKDSELCPCASEVLAAGAPGGTRGSSPTGATEVLPGSADAATANCSNSATKVPACSGQASARDVIAWKQRNYAGEA